VVEIEKALGYLNFSTGNHDPAFLQHLNQIYASLSPGPGQVACPQQVQQFLLDKLQQLEKSQTAFADSQQARRVISFCFDTALPAYREFHRDALFHQNEAFLFNSFFVGRVMETILAVDPSVSATDLKDKLLRRLIY
jgi:hypothetical protein